MHVTDLIPTLAAAANISIETEGLDGVNQWDTISLGSPSRRQEVLYNIENVIGVSAIMHDGWKLVNGSENMKNADWFGSTGREYLNVSMRTYSQNVMRSEAAKSLPPMSSEVILRMRIESTVKCSENTKALKCDPMKAPCLFNIVDDPCEQNNLADSHQGRVEFLRWRIGIHAATIVPSRRRPTDPNCDPANFNYTWSWWQEDELPAQDDMRVRNIFVYSLCGFFLVVVVLALWHQKWQKRTVFTIRK
jgi:arylsulfatase B